MHYPYPASWTKRSIRVSRNNILSAKDKALISYLYPKPIGTGIQLSFNSFRRYKQTEFPAAQKSIPGILLSIISFRWKSDVTNPNACFAFGAINITARGFNLHHP